MAYLGDKLPGAVVEQLHSRYPDSYSSFKLSVPEGEADKVLDPNLWPSGVFVNHFFARRRQPGGAPK